MIAATVEMVPDSHKPGHVPNWKALPSQWKASAALNGVAVEAISRVSPIYDLCRALKAAGCPNVGMQVRLHGRVAFTIPSIWKAAERTIREDDRSITEVPYKAWADR